VKFRLFLISEVYFITRRLSLLPSKADLSIIGLNFTFIGVGGGVKKIEACRGLDVYIDDDLDKLEPLVGIVPYRFLLTHEYNLTEKPRDVGVERIIGWPALYREIKETK